MPELLHFENLSASYPSKQILNNVSLSIKSGELVCLCGPNGCGKSSLLSVLAGLSNAPKITEAKIYPSLDDIELKLLNKKNLAHSIAFLQQNEYSTWDFSVFDFILSGRFSYTKNADYSKTDMEIANQIISQMEISDISERNIHSLSGGEFQKVRIARALTQTPEFLLLDEPASNLDFVYEPKMLEFLRDYSHKNNIGILLTIHDINLAVRFSDRIFFLPKNQFLISGTPEDVFTKENIDRTFKSDCTIYNHQIYNCRQVSL